MLIRIVDGDEISEPIDLYEFCSENCLEPEECAEIARRLKFFGFYRGGGGAAHEWEITKA